MICASRRRGGILCLLKSGRERSRHNYLNAHPHIISILDIKKMEVKKKRKVGNPSLQA